MIDKIKTQFTKFITEPKDQKVLVEVIVMGIFLVLWAQNILPLLNDTNVEPKTALIYVGFVFTSLFCILYVVPFWVAGIVFFFGRSIKRIIKYGSES